MRIEVVSALPHSTVHSAVLSRRHRSVICAGPFEILPLESCFEPLPSTSTLSEFPVECLQLSTDERTIGLATNSILKVADITTGREVRNLTGHTLPITSLAASKFSPYCWYTGSSDCTWTQWDTRMHQSKIYGSKTLGVVRSLALSPGDHYLAIGTDDNIQIFDARQRDIIQQFNCSGHTLELHPSDVLLSAVGHDRIVRFFCLENFELISQSDPFLDDIQASAFDTHVMIAATNDSINLLTWEPCCDVLTTVPLKNVEKVVNVNANGLELDFICIGDNTERLEMRSYAIEELLSYSPSHELCGSIYEEDEDVESADNSPIEESKPLPGMADIPSSPVTSSEELAETSSSPVNSTASSHSSPASPAKPASVKQRSASQKASKSTDSTSKSSLKAPSKTSSRSVTPVSTRPPATRSMVGASRSANVPQKPTLGNFRPRPSPSMSDLRSGKNGSIAGSTQSLISERGPTTRSTSKSRAQEPITITYLGRPRTPSEGDVIVSSSSASTHLPTRRRPSPAVKKSPPSVTSSPGKKPIRSVIAPPPPVVRKQHSTASSVTSTSSSTATSASTWAACIATVNRIGDTAKKENRNLRRLKMLTSRRPNGEVSQDVCSDEQLVLTAARVLSKNNGWSLNTCHAYIGTIVDNIASVDTRNRSIALSSLEAISSALCQRLVELAGAGTHRIGVDVAAEERAEKAQFCIQRLRDVVKKRDWYYKQLDEQSVQQLDLVMERIKKI